MCLMHQSKKPFLTHLFKLLDEEAQVEVLMQKLICKHKGLIPDSNVKACQPI